MNYIRSKREETGIAQRAFSESIGISRTKYQNFELGIMPNDEDLEKIAAGFEMDPQELKAILTGKYIQTQYVSLIDLEHHPFNEAIYSHETDVSDLVESIVQQGILEPLTINSNHQIISGNRRKLACLKISELPEEEQGKFDIEKIPVRFMDFENELQEKLALLSFNKQRKKTPEELWKEGEALKEIYKALGVKGRKTEKIAEELGLGSSRTYERLDTVMKQAPETIKQQVNRGELSIGDAYAQTRRVMQQPNPEQVKKKIDSGKAKNTEHAISQQREEENSDYQVELSTNFEPQELPYSALVIRPPIDHGEEGLNNPSPLKFHQQSYKPLSLEELFELKLGGEPIADLMAENSICFMFIQEAMIESGFELLRAYGFQYSQILYWEHDIKTSGELFKKNIMPCLVGISGTPEFKQEIKAQGFSNKFKAKMPNDLQSLPPRFYQMVEALVDGQCLEVFAHSKLGERWDSVKYPEYEKTAE